MAAGRREAAYAAFPGWRFDIYTRRPRETVRYFRASLPHSVIWMMVMRGHFGAGPPTLGQCQEAVACSPLTTRKLIADAVARGYLELRQDGDDSRRRLVCPTPLTVAEFKGMVDGYLDFFEGLAAAEGGRRPATDGQAPAAGRRRTAIPAPSPRARPRRGKS